MKKPKFLIQTINSNGIKEEPKLYKVQELLDEKVDDWSMSRRGFLTGVSVALAAGIFECKALPDKITGKCEDCVLSHSDSVTSLSFSPDGKLLASGSDDKTIIIWDINSGSLLKKINNNDNLKSINFSSDGKLLVSNSSSNIRIWNVSSGELLKEFSGDHANWVEETFLSPDMKYLASISTWDAAVRVWEIPSGKLLKEFGGVSPAVFSPDGKLFAAGFKDFTVKILKMPSGELLRTFPVPNDNWTRSISFSQDGKSIISYFSDGTANIWETETGRSLTRFRYKNYSGTSVILSPDGKLIAEYLDKDILNIREMPSGKLLKELNDYTDSARSLCFSPDGKLLAAVTESNTIEIKEMPSGKLLTVLSGHTLAIKSVVFSPDGKYIASGSWDKTVRIWEMRNGEFISCLFDPAILGKGKEVITYTSKPFIGQARTYTIPYGSTLPKGAVCTCNSVQGSYVPECSCVGHSGGGSYRICTCVPIK